MCGHRPAILPPLRQSPDAVASLRSASSRWPRAPSVSPPASPARSRRSSVRRSRRASTCAARSRSTASSSSASTPRASATSRRAGPSRAVARPGRAALHAAGARRSSTTSSSRSRPSLARTSRSTTPSTGPAARARDQRERPRHDRCPRRRRQPPRHRLPRGGVRPSERHERRDRQLPPRRRRTRQHRGRRHAAPHGPPARSVRLPRRPGLDRLPRPARHRADGLLLRRLPRPRAGRDDQGKIVVVGATAPTLRDVHSTPSGGEQLMPGAEVQANAIWTALDGLPLRSAPPASTCWSWPCSRCSRRSPAGASRSALSARVDRARRRGLPRRAPSSPSRRGTIVDVAAPLLALVLGASARSPGASSPSAASATA